MKKKIPKGISIAKAKDSESPSENFGRYTDSDDDDDDDEFDPLMKTQRFDGGLLPQEDKCSIETRPLVEVGNPLSPVLETSLEWRDTLSGTWRSSTR